MIIKIYIFGETIKKSLENFNTVKDFSYIHFYDVFQYSNN